MLSQVDKEHHEANARDERRQAVDKGVRWVLSQFKKANAIYEDTNRSGRNTAAYDAQNKWEPSFSHQNKGGHPSPHKHSPMGNVQYSQDAEDQCKACGKQGVL